jgi:hypothetical protein
MRLEMVTFLNLPCLLSLIYLLPMTPKTQAAQGAVGPGIQAPPPTAYALDLQKKASSRSPTVLQEVGRALTSEQDLLKLNTSEGYAQLPAEKLAVQRILARLGRNAAPSAREIFGTLCTNQAFLAEQGRLECLLQALPVVHPLPPQALPLLRKCTEPESDTRETAIRALFDIGDRSTLEIFSARAMNPQNDPVAVQGWMHDPLLRHRRDPAVLETCLALLQDSRFGSELKNSLVEALFDYRPADWYLSPEAGGGALPKPPPKVSGEARKLLKQIAAAIAADPALSEKNKSLAEKATRGD